MENIKLTLYIVFSFFASLNPFTALENAVATCKKTLASAENEVNEAEKKNDLKQYKKALEKVENAKNALSVAEKALEKVEKPKLNDLIQIAIFSCVLLGIEYTQKDIISLGANTCGQFGYTKRIVFWLSFFGYTLNCEKLKNDIMEYAKKENAKK
jgi:exonuclease VII small subunit